MLNTLKELSKYLEESDKNEVNTPVRLRSILKSVDSGYTYAYVQSFAMIICNQLFKCNNVYAEVICRDFIECEIVKFTNLKKNGIVSYPDLLSLTKKTLLEFVSKRLKSYDETKEYNNMLKYPLYRVHYKAISNKRTKQEDRYFGVSNVVNYAYNHSSYKNESCAAEQPFNHDNLLFVGMFDGHNGPEAAEHCHHLAPHFVSTCLQNSLCYKGQYNLIEILGDTYNWLNNTLNGCRNKYRWKAGTTSTMCLIDKDYIYTSWVGDCSAWLICKDNVQVPLTDVLHRPSQTSEVVDVWNNGGIVTRSGSEYDRVNGILAVTRALGDDRKIVGVSPLPSVSEYKLDDTELCLVVATDGLWDCSNCSGAEIGDLCRNYFSDHGTDPGSIDTVCQLIVDRAVKAGASDNISVIVIVFGDDDIGGDRRRRCSPRRDDKHTDIVRTDRHSSSNNEQHSQSVRWPRDRRRSCFQYETDYLRCCPLYLDDYLQSHFSHNVKMHSLLAQTRTLTKHASQRWHTPRYRARSLSQDIDKRFSSPIRWINKS